MIKNIREKFFNRNIITIYRHTYKSTRLVTRRARIELFEALRESRMAERVVAVADKRTRKMVEERERISISRLDSRRSRSWIFSLGTLHAYPSPSSPSQGRENLTRQ